MEVTRRHLVLGAAAAGVVAAAYATLRQVGMYPESQEFRTLSDMQVAIFRVLGDYLLPPGGPLPGSGGDDATLARLAAYVEGMPPDKRWIALGLPLVFEHGTAFDRYGARRLTQLPPERQVAYLDAWNRTHLLVPQQLMLAARSLIGLSYFDRPDVQAAMGMPLACTGTR